MAMAETLKEPVQSARCFRTCHDRLQSLGMYDTLFVKRRTRSSVLKVINKAGGLVYQRSFAGPCFQDLHG